MVNKKAAAGVAALTAVGIAALALSRREAPLVEEGSPEGEVALEVTSLGMPQGYSYEELYGAYGVGSTITITGKCTAGFPKPEMKLEILDKGVVKKTKTITSVELVIGTAYTDTLTMGAADVGDHSIVGRMVLTNPLGSYQFTTAASTFDIGVIPPGEVSIVVTLTPA